MGVFSQGKYALAISDRSGMAFPYNEMVREWNGALVHVSEYEPKQPQLDPKPTSADPQALQRARTARTEFPTEDFLPQNPITTTAADATGTATTSATSTTGPEPTADGASDTTNTELDGRTYTEGEKNKQRKSSRKVAQ